MRLRADLQLLLVTVIWGSGFAVMRLAAGYHTVFLFNGIRFLLGGFLLLPWIKFKGKVNRSSLVFIVLAGIILYGASNLQQGGLITTTAGNAGFITSLYVVIVPLLLWVLWRERPTSLMIIAAPLALAGGYLLSTGGIFHPRVGDILMFVGSILWALHVIVIAKAQGKIDPFLFAFGQFTLCGLLSLITGAFFERPSGQDLITILPAILYTATFSIALGFTIQVIAQRHTPPTDAALILSMEAVFAAIFGWVFIHESLMPLQVLGCLLIFMAVIIVQLNRNRMRLI